MTSKHLPVLEPKAGLRRAGLGRRREVHRDKAASAAQALTERLMTDIGSVENTIAGYWPIGDEIDCRPAMEKLAKNGAQLALPVVAGQGQVLIFRIWKPGEQLETGPFGTSHPGLNSGVCVPSILLLPLIAFDKTGQRLGDGAGYYDRTIAALRAGGKILAVGVGYDEQEIEHLPADDHDQVMDAVITDQRTLWFNAAERDN